MLVSLQHLTLVTTLWRSCLTEHGAPVESCTGRYGRGWHCRRSSILNTIGDVITRTFLKLTNIDSGSGIYSVRL